MIRFTSVIRLAAFSLFLLCQTVPAKANLLTNGDFSGGSLGWTTEGSAVVTAYSGLPVSYHERWDLSSWQGVLDEDFMLFEGGRSLFASLDLTDLLSAAQPLSFSLDYAVAWDWVNPVNGIGNDFGNFNVQFSGRNVADGRFYPVGPSNSEIVWGPSAGGTKGVLTGTLSVLNITPLVDGLYDHLSLSLLLLNPNQTLFQIAGFDNASLSANSGSAAPIPEPSTLLLLIPALAGVAFVAGKRKTHVRGAC